MIPLTKKYLIHTSMSFEEFKGITYHTRESIRIPGSTTVIDKLQLVTKRGFNSKKADEILRKVYDNENYKDR